VRRLAAKENGPAADISLMKDHTELFKQFSDNPKFKRWPADTIFSVTYHSPRLPL
jgi:type I restriction enzyme, R subunit